VAILIGIALLAAALFGLAVPPSGRIGALGTICACGIGIALDIWFLVFGVPATALVIPIGPPGIGMTLALDGLSAFFLLLVFIVGGAAALASLDHDQAATARAFPPFIAGMVLTLIAGDGFSLVLGFEAMSLASFVLVATHDAEPESRSAALLYLGIALLGAACLIPAVALLAPPGPLGEGLKFAAMRAHPPEGWRATVVFVLVLIGAGAKAGMAPLHVWLPPAHAAAPAHVSALMSGAMTKVALYVVARALFDLCGLAQPQWWSVPLLLLGAAGAVIGGLRATLEPDIKTVLACSTVENVGLIAIGLGVALAARGADLTSLATLAAGGALLHAMAHGTFKSLLFLGAGAVQDGAGTRMFSRLGGLIHRMPITTGCMLVGAAGLAALPPGSGFAGEWMLFQAVLGAPRAGDLSWQFVVCVVAALMAMAAALAAAAAVRLIGVAFLGRPRSPRASAAVDPEAPARWAMLGLAVITGLIGLFPGVVLGLARPAMRVLLPGGVADQPSMMVLSPNTGSSGYIAIVIAILLGLCGGAAVFLMRRHAVAGHVTGPAWDCGFGAPPAWLPFGDTATQYTGASFSQPLRRAIGGAILDAREIVDMPLPGETRPARFTTTMADPSATWLFAAIAALRAELSRNADRMQWLTIRRTLVVMFSALVLFLAVVAVMERM
jgi:LPXTG-motif cell wall-anchored protein